MNTPGGASHRPTVPPAPAGSVVFNALTLTGSGSPPPGEGRSLAIILIAGAIPVVAGVMLLITAAGGSRPAPLREGAASVNESASPEAPPGAKVLATRPAEPDARGGDIQLPRDPSKPPPGTVVRRQPAAQASEPAAGSRVGVRSPAPMATESAGPSAGVAPPATPLAPGSQSTPPGPPVLAPSVAAPPIALPIETRRDVPPEVGPLVATGPTPAERELAAENRVLREEVLSLREQLDGASGRLATVVRDVDAAAQQARAANDALQRARVLLGQTQRARESESARRLAAELERDRLRAALLETHELYARLTPARIEHRRLSQRGQRVAERARVPLAPLWDGIGDLFVGVLEAIGGPGGSAQYVAVFAGGAEVLIDEPTAQRWREVGVPLIDRLAVAPAAAPVAVPPPTPLRSPTPPAQPGPPIEPMPVELPPAATGS